MKFLGHVDPSGIRSDPDKNYAIKEMPEPSTPTEVRRFLGMVNQLGKFLPRLAKKTEPLRALITSKSEWMLGHSQLCAFETIKEDLYQPPVLALHSPTRPTDVSSDASAYGLGAIIRQKQDNGE